MTTGRSGQTVLGLDLGSGSVGWALLGGDRRGELKQILALGAHVFDAGLDDLQKDGRGKPRNAARREARLRRRQTRRHAQRATEIAGLLQKQGLLPDGDLQQGDRRHELILALDRKLCAERDLTSHDREVLPYRLRAWALDEPLSAHELGRAFYHLGQRRGFLSNRKAPPKEKEELGLVKKGIGDLERLMANAGDRTLGEHFSHLNPREERIRSRYTARQMYLDEFEAIWAAQEKHHAATLTPAFKEALHRALFFQRPLKPVIPGACEHQPDKTRAPWGLLIAQKFRLLQQINNLRIIDTDTGEETVLSEEQRGALRDALSCVGRLTFTSTRKALGLSRKHKFNLQIGGEKELIGNRTAAEIIEAIGEAKWKALSEDEQEQMVEDLRSIEKEETLLRRAAGRWGLNREQAIAFNEIALQPGYCHLSRTALGKLVPLMESGIAYATAVKEVYGAREASDPLEMLPPVEDVLLDVRNPIVMRTLTEMRKVVNEVIRVHGKPDRIRIELARELKKSADQRGAIMKKNRALEKERTRAAERIAEEVGITQPSRSDILKVQLADECGWRCPYTDKAISMQTLLGGSPQFDIEHIIPLQRSLDNSFLNKTLSDVAENRKVKRDQTPFETYGSDPDRWKEIVDRVEKFKNPVKLDRFTLQGERLEKYLDGFASRQLNDTAYASRLAMRYAGALYGGEIDADHVRRVQAGSGQVTAYLRGVWGLNRALIDTPAKSRDDHRHHAIDAVAIALTTPGAMKELSSAASRGYEAGRDWFTEVPPPWDRFFEQAQEAIHAVITSHRVDRKLQGALHEETLYSPPIDGPNGKPVRHVRKLIDSLSAKQVQNIADKRVREAVEAKLAELGQPDPAKAFKDPANHPILPDGPGTPIHKVRLRVAATATIIGKGASTRHVKTGSNHHMVIYEDQGSRKWDAIVVSRYVAMQRFRKKTPVLDRNMEPGKKFLFSLACGEIIELDGPSSVRGLYRVRTIPQSKQIRFVAINEGRPLKDVPKKDHTAYPETLRRRKCRKVTVSRLGEVRRAND